MAPPHIAGMDRPGLDFEAIRSSNQLSTVVGKSIKLRRAGQEWKACCPFHPDRTPSFTIMSCDTRFYCFGCGASGDVLDFVARHYNVPLRDAAAMLGDLNLPSNPLPSKPVADIEKTTMAQAAAIWQRSVPIAGTVGQVYLQGRGLKLATPNTVRFARLRYGTAATEYPAIVALVTNEADEPIGIQRTYLAHNGSGKAPVEKAKLSLGHIRGGAIRLAPVAAEMVVCEGLEDGLTLQQELGRAVWAAAGASNLPTMKFPPEVGRIAIGRDNDDAGELAATRAMRAYIEQGLKVRVIAPEPEFKDFNDEIRGII